MKQYTVIFCKVSLFLKSSVQISNLDSPSYLGAVVQFHPIYDEDDAQKAAEANANHYQTIIRRAAQNFVDIIVFPESALTSVPNKYYNYTNFRAYIHKAASYSPDPDKNVLLCDDESVNYKRSLRSISCAAREYKMYVVVNHVERADCPSTSPNCTSDKMLFYNSNFVFDRQGRLISKYRKFNLFGENGTDIPTKPEIATFITDFNVTFGQFICADIIRDKPTLTYVKNPKITDVITTVHWYDDRPFAQSLEYQAGWAYSADVNLLASGASNVLTGTTGMGVYIGRNGPIKTFRSQEDTNALLIAEIPKYNKRDRFDDYSLKRKARLIIFSKDEISTIYEPPINQSKQGNIYTNQLDLKTFTTKLISNNVTGPQIEEICNNGMCCNFHVESTFNKAIAARSNSSYFKYRLVAFKGVRKIGNETSAGIEVCGLISCISDKLQDCSKDFPVATGVFKPTVFQKIIIMRTGVTLSNHTQYMPFSIDQHSYPLNSSDFSFFISGHENSSTVIMALDKPKDNIMDFGIIARRFDEDGKPLSVPSAANLITVSLLPLLIISLLLGLLTNI